MKKGILLGTTGLSGFRSGSFTAPMGQPPIGRFPGVRNRHAEDARMVRRRGAGISVTQYLRIPRLTDEQLADLTAIRHEKVTYHFSSRWRDSNLAGFFKFGTLAVYGRDEGIKLSRLSDNTEGSMQTRVNPGGGYIMRGDVLGVSVVNSGSSGVDLVSATIHANDYCRCLSKGPFCPRTGVEINEHEDVEAHKVDYYITYDFERLVEALMEELGKIEEAKSKILVWSDVTYGDKDSLAFACSDYYFGLEEISKYENWVKIAFQKIEMFSHEREFRILLVDRDRPGALNVGAGPLIIEESPLIASAIVDHGYFDS